MNTKKILNSFTGFVVFFLFAGINFALPKQVFAANSCFVISIQSATKVGDTGQFQARDSCGFQIFCSVANPCTWNITGPATNFTNTVTENGNFSWLFSSLGDFTTTFTGGYPNPSTFASCTPGPYGPCSQTVTISPTTPTPTPPPASCTIFGPIPFADPLITGTQYEFNTTGVRGTCGLCGFRVYRGWTPNFADLSQVITSSNIDNYILYTPPELGKQTVTYYPNITSTGDPLCRKEILVGNDLSASCTPTTITRGQTGNIASTVQDLIGSAGSTITGFDIRDLAGNQVQTYPGRQADSYPQNQLWPWTPAVAGTYTATVYGNLCKVLEILGLDPFGTCTPEINEANYSNNTNTCTITVIDPTPTPTTIPTPICSSINGSSILLAGQSDTYTATTTGSINTYSWSATGGSPTLGSSSIFPWSSSSAGNFTISLTVSGLGGSAACPPKLIRVDPALPSPIPPTNTPIPTAGPSPTPTLTPTPSSTPVPSITCNFTGPTSVVAGSTNNIYIFNGTATNTTINWSISPWTTTAGSPTNLVGSSTLNWTAPVAAGSYPSGTINLTVDDVNPGGAPTSSCTNAFTITVTTPTPTPIGGGGGPTPTPTPPGGATPTPAGAATPTPTPSTPSVSCSVSPTPNAQINQTVLWNAFASGGTGTYTYSWSDTTGGSRTFGPTGVASDTWSKTYPSVGSVTATVTVTSGSISPPCSKTITIVSSFPWFKTTGGDVHTNQYINTPGGPTRTP